MNKILIYAISLIMIVVLSTTYIITTIQKSNTDRNQSQVVTPDYPNDKFDNGFDDDTEFNGEDEAVNVTATSVKDEKYKHVGIEYEVEGWEGIYDNTNANWINLQIFFTPYWGSMQLTNITISYREEDRQQGKKFVGSDDWMSMEILNESVTYTIDIALTFQREYYNESGRYCIDKYSEYLAQTTLNYDAGHNCLKFKIVMRNNENA